MLFRWHRAHSNLQHLFWCGRITSSCIPQFPIFQWQRYAKTHLRTILIYIQGEINSHQGSDRSKCNFLCDLQVRQGRDDFKHSPSSKQNHPLAILITNLCCPRYISPEGTSRTLFHPVSAVWLHDISSPFPCVLLLCCALYLQHHWPAEGVHF